MNDTALLLIIDDETLQRQADARRLAAAGFYVTQAATAADGWQAARVQRPDLVILRHQLPDGDGLTLCRRIKAIPELAHIPVLMVSSLRTQNGREADCRAAGAAACLSRPYRPNELLDWARTLVRLKHAEELAGWRVRELDALQRISQLAARPELALPDLLPLAAALITPAMRFPERAAAQITLGDHRAETATLADCGPRLSQDIRLNGQPAGWVLVAYPDCDPAAMSVLFGHHERQVLASLVGRLEQVIEFHQVQRALHLNERRFRAAFEHAAIGRCHTSPDGRLLRVNRALAAMLGYTPEELIGRKIADFTHPDDVDRSFDAVNRLLAGDHQTDRILKRYVGRDNAEIWAEVTTYLLRDDQNRPLYFANDVLDVTRRVLAERESQELLVRLQAQAEQLEQVMASVPEGVLLLDPTGRVLLVNPAGRELLADLADSAAIGDTLTRLGNVQLGDLFTSPPRGLWHRLELPGARPRYFEALARPVEAGELSRGWVIVLHEVTRDVLAQSQVQQQERLAAVGQLAGGIAHDFNNIMSVIVLYSQMGARTPGLGEPIAGRLKVIEQQAKRATELTQQILDFSRRSLLERSPLDLAPFLKELVKLLQRTMPDDIRVELDITPGAGLINADPTRIQQAVMNLAFNARDAMPDGGRLRLALRPLQVTRAADAPVPGMAAGGWIELVVSDSGQGIPSEHLPHIFEPFFTTKPPGKGTGLGLAQVYGIVRQHDGQIQASSRLGSGTRMTIYLPVHGADLPQQLVVPAADQPAAGGGETILVVEDNTIVRDAVVSTLEELNYRVLQAANGRVALELLQSAGPEVALVVSDLVMPEMGGKALFHALQTRRPELPIVIMTGHPLSADNGSNGIKPAGWLQKPIHVEQLADVLSGILNPRASRS